MDITGNVTDSQTTLDHNSLKVGVRHFNNSPSPIKQLDELNIDEVPQKRSLIKLQNDKDEEDS